MYWIIIFLILIIALLFSWYFLVQLDFGGYWRRLVKRYQDWLVRHYTKKLRKHIFKYNVSYLRYKEIQQIFKDMRNFD